MNRTSAVRLAFSSGLAAALLSTALTWRGRMEQRSAAAPLNAISHWFWPRSALWRDDVSLRHTGTGIALHLGSSLLWSTVYALLRSARPEPGPVDALGDAAAVTALAATVDLAIVPERLSPGFEHRLRPAGLGWVYGAFAVGLAAAGCFALRRS
jgi:hypothetical protein